MVDRDFSDVRVNNGYFAVDPRYRGDKLEVRWDPFQLERELQEVELYSPSGQYLGVGRRYERQPGYHAQPAPRDPPAPIVPTYLEALLASHRARQQEQRSAGLDFHSAARRNVWPFASFAAALARLLGRSSGLSALSPEELEALRQFHARHDRVHEAALRAAVAQAASPTIPHVLWSLQVLLSPGDG
jgi:hypothetical protein